MPVAEYAFEPVYKLAAAMRRQEISPLELMELYLHRIERYDEKLQAFVCVYADEARQAAAAATQALNAGHDLGPLHGIPIALKDLVDIEGRITTGGSKCWQNRISPGTATIVHKLRAAGMIVIGKTHTVEFAYGGWGTNQHCGTPWNPWDLDTHRVPGGSSSGSGVSTAAGLTAAAIGSDTGGSVRLPAAFCGLVGLKTTVGRISLHGVLPLSGTLDTIGPLTRSVEDAALLFNALQGPDPLDPGTYRQPVNDPLPHLRKGVAGLRLARLPDNECDIVDSEVLNAYQQSLQVLEKLGAQIVDIRLPQAIDAYRDAVSVLIGAEGYCEVGELCERGDLIIDQYVRQRMLAARDLSAKDYILALRERERAKQAFAEALDRIDAFLTPTTVCAAIPLTEVDEAVTPAQMTRFGNLLDLCGLAVPNGYTRDGLPASLLINARGYDEAMALRIGWAYEQATLEQKRIPAGLSD